MPDYFVHRKPDKERKKTIFSNGSLYFLKDWLSMKKKKKQKRLIR